MPPVWRLIEHGPVDGALNMAIDRAIQLARERDAVPPTLRLYWWTRPTVTLGRFQTLDGVDAVSCAEYGIDIVRRFTGGRGVLHDEELTYSVVAGVDDGVPRGVAASYRHLSQALALAYNRMGVAAELTTRDRGHGAGSACYLQTTRADLSLGAMKLSGSAQVWVGDTVLQHGSFTMRRDLERESRVFMLDEAQRHKLGAHTFALADAAAGPWDRAGITQVVVGAFQDQLGIRLCPAELTAFEAESVESLLDHTRAEKVPLRGSGS